MKREELFQSKTKQRKAKLECTVRPSTASCTGRKKTVAIKDIIGELTKLEHGIKKLDEKCCVNDKFLSVTAVLLILKR